MNSRKIYVQGEDLYTTVVHYSSASVFLMLKYVESCPRKIAWMEDYLDRLLLSIPPEAKLIKHSPGIS